MSCKSTSRGNTTKIPLFIVVVARCETSVMNPSKLSGETINPLSEPNYQLSTVKITVNPSPRSLRSQVHQVHPAPAAPEQLQNIPGLHLLEDKACIITTPNQLLEPNCNLTAASKGGMWVGLRLRYCLTKHSCSGKRPTQPRCHGSRRSSSLMVAFKWIF